MSIRNLHYFFDPKVIAIISCGESHHISAEQAIRHLIKNQFRGTVLPITYQDHSRHNLAGILTYPDLTKLPHIPDLAIIYTAPSRWLDLITVLSDIGTKSVLLISQNLPVAEFTPALIQQVLTAAQPNNMRIIGPVRLGIAAMQAHFNALSIDLPLLRGKIAFIGQSCALMRGILDWACAQKIGFSHVISLGDARPDVDYADILDYMATDRHTSAIIIQVDQIHHTRKFISAARVASRLKPVIVLKSHDRRCEHADLIYDAAFARAGLMRVKSIADLTSSLKTLDRFNPSTPLSAQRKGLVVIANAYNIGNMMLDALHEYHGHITVLTDDTIHQLQTQLPHLFPKIPHQPSNPIKFSDAMPVADCKILLDILLRQKDLGGILIVGTASHAERDQELALMIANCARQAPVPIFTSWIGGIHAQAAIDIFTTHQVAHYADPVDAILEFTRNYHYRVRKNLLMETPPSYPESFTVDHQTVRDIIEHAKTLVHTQLNILDSFAILKAYDIPVITTYITYSLSNLTALTQAFVEPMVLKIRAKNLKTRLNIGGIRFGLEGHQITEAAHSMYQHYCQHYSADDFEGFEIQPMLTRGNAFELNISVQNTHFGPMICFGQGGTEASVINDFAYALPPLNMLLAKELIARTRIYSLLNQTAGRNVDLDQLQLMLIKVSQMVVDIPELSSITINPLWADAEGVRVLDASIQLNFQQPAPHLRLAIRPYPSELAHTFECDDQQYLIRPITPEDEPMLQLMIQRAPCEDVRMRFFQALKNLPHETAARLTQLDYERDMAFCVTEPGLAGQMPLYAVVHLNTESNLERAEYSIMVARELSGKGIGRYLMNYMIKYAKSRHIKALYGEVLSENTNMLALNEKLGFQIHRHPEDSSLKRVSLNLELA